MSIVSLALLIALCGCARAPSSIDMEGPYASRFDDALRQANDLEYEVLSDGVITRQEYAGSIERFAECMESYGSRFGLFDNYGYFEYVVEDEAQANLYDRHRPECRVGTVGLIEPLYVDILMNPQNLAPGINFMNCLERRNEVPGAVTLQMAEEFLLDGRRIDIPQPIVDSCLANPGEATDGLFG